MSDLPRVGVLASGTGTNLQALIDAVHGREVEIAGVASDKPGAVALERARAAGIETAIFVKDEYRSRAARDEAMAGWLDGLEVGVVVLAGYMAILDEAFIARFRGRIVNVHPSLLPAFPGIRAIEQAVEHGVHVFGVTVHLVDEGVDTGPIILQRSIELPGATDPEVVHHALQPLEHEMLPRAVAALARGEVRADPANPRRLTIEQP